MQLETLSQTTWVNTKKYEHPNGIKEEEEEDDSLNPFFQTKNSTREPTIKKLKSITQNIHPNVLKKDSHKLNRTIENSIQTKKPNNKDLRENEPIKAPKKEDKSLKSIGRRMSLTALSFSSTTESSMTVPCQSEKPICMIDKKKLIEKVKGMEMRISKKSISENIYEQLIESIERLNEILDDC